MFTAALGMGALQAQDTKPIEGIWFAESTTAKNVESNENNLKEGFKDAKQFAVELPGQKEKTIFAKEEFLQALGEPIEMRIDFNPKYVVSIKAGELLIAEINGSGFTDRYKIKEVKKTKATFLITTTLGEEFTLENNAGGLLLTKTKSLSKAPTMQMQLSK